MTTCMCVCKFLEMKSFFFLFLFCNTKNALLLASSDVVIRRF